MITSLLTNIMLSLLAYILYSITKNILFPILKYQLRKHEYTHLPQSPHSFLSTVGSGKASRTEALLEGVRGEDGMFRKIVHCRFHIDGSHWVCVADPELAKQVLMQMDLPKYQVQYDFIAPLLGYGLVVSSGEKWKLMRKLITPLFHFDSLKAYVPRIAGKVEGFREQLLNESSEFVDAKGLFSKLTMDIIVDLAFGNEMDPRVISEKFTRATSQYNNAFLLRLLFGNIVNYLPGKYGKGTYDLIQEIKGDIIKAIQHRNGNPTDDNDLINVLLQGKDSQGNPISPLDIVAECKTFLFAGSDTTSATLAFVMYHLGRNPEVIHKMRDEITSVLGDREIEYEDLVNLKYIKNVIKESLRLSPVVFRIDRYTDQAIELNGEYIPKNTVIGVLFWPSHRNQTYWENPEQYIPERWETEKPVPFLYTPFSAGKRNCLGEKFAMIEMQMILVMIVRSFNIEIDDSDYTYSWDGVTSPHGLKVKLDPL
eukprot:TRINITY_DN626_c0_g1_i1.p1 TRINITY_DN626_c0_g1~~TRINITY_DN626_c0_g1_i1.p1  ORF type:complete len:497 (-),score=88.15 TRINITY_DN626_c0_g1_i1:43-1488(-)